MADKNIKLIIEAVLKDKGFQKGVKGMGTSMQKTSKVAMGFTKVLGALGLAGGIYALVGIMKRAIKTHMEFEQSVANVASVSGDSTKAIAELARKMGKDTVFSAKTATDAMYFLASSGMKVKEMNEVLAPTLNLAAAGQMGIAEATEVVIGTLNVFRKTGISATEMTNVMAQTVKESSTDMSQMAEALKMSASAASIAGVSFKDLTAMIGSMADINIKGMRGGRQLRMVFARLSGGIGPVNKALEEYFEHSEEITDLLPTPIKMFEKLAKVNISNKDAIKIFGVQNLGVFKMIKDNLPKVKELTKSYKSMGDVAKKMAEKQLDTLTGQMKMLNAAYEEIIHSLMGSSGVSVGLKEVTKDLVEQTRALGEWTASAEGIYAVTAAVETLGLIFMGLWHGIITPLFNTLKLLISNAIQGVTTLGETVYYALTGQWKKIPIAWKIGNEQMEKNNKNFVDTVSKNSEKLVNKASKWWRAITKDYTKEADNRVSTGAKETEALGKGYKKGTKEFKKAEKEKTRIAKEESKKRKQLLSKYTEYILSDFAKRIKANKEMADKMSESKRMRESYAEYKRIQKKRKEDVVDLATFVMTIAEQNKAEREKLDREASDKYGLTLELATNMTKVEAEKRAKVWAEYLKKYGKKEKKTAEKSKNLWEEMTETQRDAFESISTIVGKIGDEIGGEMGQAVNAVNDFVGALLKAGTDPMAIMTTLIVAAISFIVNEFTKAQMHMELMENLRIENMERVHLEVENQAIARLEREKARTLESFDDRQKALDDEKKALDEIFEYRKQLLDKQYSLEAENYGMMNEATRAYYDMLKSDEDERYALMSEDEKRKYDIKKRYDEQKLVDEKKLEKEKKEADERKKLADEKLAKEKEAAEKKATELIKIAKMKRFKIEQKIAVAKMRIARTEANAEINKNFPMPWDARRRQQAKDAMNSMYDKLINLTKAQQPSFEKGTERVPKTGAATVHTGERIIPARMNIPNVNNEDLMAAAFAGLPVTQGGQVYNSTSNNNANNSRNITIQNVTLPNVTNAREMLLELQEVADGMDTSLLNQ